ncbi:MAG: M14 family zinc carboxypeptidase, partial [Candidatus Syntrophosphaera sp.]
MTDSPSQLREWDSYPTYDAYVAMMNSFAAEHPDLCQIVNAGTTVDGRSILIARISDNVGTHEMEPEVLFTSTMHGDELTGYILMLRLIDTLLTGYGTDPRLTGIVDNMELWIGPNTNPDGTYYGGNGTVSGARRYNANGVDLNRNFPDADGSLNGTIQPETQAMMDLADAHHFVFGANFHGGAEVVNYPWDYTYAEHPDDAWYYASSLVYAASAQANGPSGYFTGISPDGVTNGADWYVIDGGRQDWMNYTAHAREVTIEVSNTKAPPASQMPDFWNYNHDALLSYLEQSLLGIHGTVIDLAANPLDATITIDGHDNSYSVVETDPAHGDFYRYLSPGTYALTATTAGYDPKTVYVTVTAVVQTPLTIVFGQLEPPSLSFGQMQISDPPPGDGDGNLDPGETVTITILLNNLGDEPSPSGTATLSCYTPGITVNDGTDDFAAIEGHSLATLSFSISADISMETGTVVTLEFSASAGDYTAGSTQSTSVGIIIEDFESGDFASYTWEFGDHPWTLDNAEHYSGSYAAKSGDIADDQTSTIQITRVLSSPGDISFWYKVSSESGYDYLFFHIDGALQGYWSGEEDWTQTSHPVEAGTRTFTWSYAKDGSVGEGSDCAWVDDIILPASISYIPATITWNPPSFDQQLGPDETASQSLTIGNDGSETLTYTVSKPTGEENLLDESFESAALPAGWIQEYVTGSVDWDFVPGGLYGNPASAYDGSYNARLFYSSSSNNYVTRLITPSLDLSSAASATLSFWHAQEIWYSDQDEMKVYYRTSPTGVWNQLAHYTDSIAEWTQETILLPSLSATCQIAFEGITSYGYGVCLDKVVVTANNPVTVDWLTVNGGDSHSGSINAGEADQNISIGFNSAGLSEGIYTSHLTVLSNDPQNPSFNIPIQLTVMTGSLGVPQ